MAVAVTGPHKHRLLGLCFSGQPLWGCREAKGDHRNITKRRLLPFDQLGEPKALKKVPMKLRVLAQTPGKGVFCLFCIDVLKTDLGMPFSLRVLLLNPENCHFGNPLKQDPFLYT